MFIVLFTIASVDKAIIFRKETCLQFIKQLSFIQTSSADMALADSMFSVMTNDYPIHVETKFSKSVIGKVKRNEKDAIERNVLQGARTLYRMLQDPLQPYFATRAPMQSDIRAPCKNVDCMFLTSLEAVPLPESVSFEPNVKMLEDHVKKYAPVPAMWASHAFHNAVDQDESTCWSHLGATTPKLSYFGLDLLQLEHGFTQFELVFDMNDKHRFVSFFDRLQVQVAHADRQFYSVHPSIKVLEAGNKVMYTLPSVAQFRFIKFVVPWNLNFGIKVCEIVAS